MESYKINCIKNLIIGYETIKASEETSQYKDDFVHVVLSKLKDYTEPVVVKIYDNNNFHLDIETKILEVINGYRNTATLICDFTCDDNKERYIKKITRHIHFCNKNGSSEINNNLHFFVYEYIAYGDISEFFMKNPDSKIIISLILQIMCVIIQLATIYGIYHGDINTGNILIDKIDNQNIDYCIEGTNFTIKTYGIIPKIIDYGRSNFYQKNTPIPINNVWFDVIMAFGVIYPYINDSVLKQKVLNISQKSEMSLPSLKDYYNYVYNTLFFSR